MSVRDRLDAQAIANRDAAEELMSGKRVNHLVVGNAPTLSQRNKADIASCQSSPDTTATVRATASAGFGTARYGNCERVRDRQAACQWNKEQAVPAAAPALSSYQIEYNQQQAADAAERAELIRTGKLIIL
jgi:hypothetical protein